jgi:hypothetical protein
MHLSDSLKAHQDSPTVDWAARATMWFVVSPCVDTCWHGLTHNRLHVCLLACNLGHVQSLVMGIAMASNVGGMTSPISSPQNIFAISLMSVDGKPPNWLDWFLVALPVSCVLNVLIWQLLLSVYKPGAHCGPVRPLPTPTDKITSSQVRCCLIFVCHMYGHEAWKIAGAELLQQALG